MTSTGVALVTGSGRRLGRQIALSLAQHGYDLVVNYNRAEVEATKTCELIKHIGRECIAVKADIRIAAEVDNLVQESLAKYAGIDVLVNNAGIFIRRLWDEIDIATWEEVLDTNLTGTFLCSQAVGRQMAKQGNGRIINIASIGGIQAWSRHIPYSVSKSGVISLTRCFARALAPAVMVNAISPGTIVMEGEEDPKVQHAPLDRIPLKRYGTPADISSLVVFLATSASYVTGQVFAVDGGRSIDMVPV